MTNHDELRRLETKATAAPWHVTEDADYVLRDGKTVGVAWRCINAGDGDVARLDYSRRADALLIAAARNALPTLLDAMEALRGEYDDIWARLKVTDEGGPLRLGDAISHAYDKGTASDRCGLEHRQLYVWLLELRLCRSDLRRLLTALDNATTVHADDVEIMCALREDVDRLTRERDEALAALLDQEESES